MTDFLTRRELNGLEDRLSEGESLSFEEKIALARDIGASMFALRELAEDADWEIRCQVAQNPSTPNSVLGDLASDDDGDVCKAAIENLNSRSIYFEKGIPAPDISVLSVATKMEIAEDSGASKALLALLAIDKNLGVRGTVALNSVCPQDVLAQLANDENCHVRAAVAANPNTEPEVLGEMAKVQDELSMVCVKLAQNPNTPKEALVVLMRNSDPTVRAAVAASPSIPPVHLPTLGHDNNWQVACAALRNPLYDKGRAELTETIDSTLAGYEIKEQAITLTERCEQAAEAVRNMGDHDVSCQRKGER
jgi:hypothetical protein